MTTTKSMRVAAGLLAAGALAGLASLAAAYAPTLFIAGCIAALPATLAAAGFALLARRRLARTWFAAGLLAVSGLTGLASLAAVDYLLFPVWGPLAEMLFVMAAAWGISRPSAAIAFMAALLAATVCGLLVGIIACGVRIGLAWDRHRREK